MREIIAKIIAYVEQHGSAVEEAVAQLWDSVSRSLTPEERERLAQRGLNAAVLMEVSKQRYVRGEPPTEKLTVRVQSRQSEVTQTRVRVTVWDDVSYKTPDGRMTPIGKFLVSDWQWVGENAAAHAKGEMRVARFARKMVRTLNEHECDRTADLPKAVLADLASASPWVSD